MASIAERVDGRTPSPDALSGSTRAHGIDRWIFVFMAAWFIAVTLIGFIPDSVAKVGMVRMGKRPDFPPELHIHALLMGTFLCLLLAQSWLMATGRQAHHARLGLAGAGLAIAVVVSAAAMVPTLYHQTWDALQVAPPDARARLQATLDRSESLLARQISLGILFTAFMAIGFWARTHDAGLHKRMMLLATALPMSAGFSRIAWLPSNPPASAITADLYSLAAIAPLFIWDVVRNRRVHRAYWLWLAGCLPFATAVYQLWDEPWWHAMARRIMGV